MEPSSSQSSIDIKQTPSWARLNKALADARCWLEDCESRGVYIHPERIHKMIQPALNDYVNMLAKTAAGRDKYDAASTSSSLWRVASRLLGSLDFHQEPHQILAYISQRLRGAIIDGGRERRKTVQRMGRNVARYEREFRTRCAIAEADGRLLTEAEKDEICTAVVPSTSLPTTWQFVRYSKPPEQVFPEQYTTLTVAGAGDDDDELDEDACDRIHMLIANHPDAELRMLLVEHMDHPTTPPLPLDNPDFCDRLSNLRETIDSFSLPYVSRSQHAENSYA